MKNKLIIYIGLFFLAIAGCKKVAPGITSTVTGIVRDTTFLAPVANAKISIGEYKPGAYGEELVGIVGSAVTGADGKFLIRYTTTGKGNEYQIKCALDSTYFNSTNVRFIAAGKDTAVNFEVVKLLPQLVRVIVKNNPYPPLTVYQGPSYAIVHGTNNDTTFTLLTFQKSYEQIRFGVQYPGESQPRYFYQDLSYAGNTSPITFTVEPSTFPKSN